MLKQKDACERAGQTERNCAGGSARERSAAGSAGEAAGVGAQQPLSGPPYPHPSPLTPVSTRQKHRPAAQDAAELERRHPPWT